MWAAADPNLTKGSKVNHVEKSACFLFIFFSKIFKSTDLTRNTRKKAKFKVISFVLT